MTPAQLSTLQTYISNTPALASQPMDGNGNAVIADALNLPFSPAFKLWRSTTPAADVNDAILWAAMTPVDSPDSTVIFTNRALVCQAKQINLQIFIQGRDTINSGKASIRNGFNDALANVPSGAGGALTPAGWNAVKIAMTRNASVAEKLLSTGTGTAAAPADIGWEGTLTTSDVDTIRHSV